MAAMPSILSKLTSVFWADSYDPWDQKSRNGQASILPLDIAESQFSAKVVKFLQKVF